MPILTLETNQHIEPERCKELLHDITALLSKMLEKPIDSIIVQIRPGAHLMMAGNPQPALFAELKVFTVPDGRADSYVKTLTEFMQKELDVAPDLQYHRFIEMEPSLFGWNGKTC